MAGVQFPSSFDVTGRFPLDSKFWVASVTNLSDGEIYAGLHRWTLDTGKEYVYQQNNTWKDVSNGDKGDAGTVTIGYVTTGPEAAVVNRGTTSDAILDITIPKGDAGSTPIIDIGTTTAGNTPSVTNVGTPDRAILNFVIPASAPGVNGLDGKSIWFAYASDINGLNPSYSSLNKNFISIASAYLQPAINTFTSWIQIKSNDGVNGTSAFIAYSAFSNGSGATFTLNIVHKYISIIVALTQPLLTDFTTWVLFKGLDGGPAGDSAYQTWLKLGNNGSEALFISSLAGATGLSAYQVWLALGNVGTQQQFINSLAVDTTIFASKTYVNTADALLRTDINTNTSNIATNANTLATKVDKVTGLGLSTNDYTTADKTRLAGILPVIAGTNIILDTTTTPGSRIINAVIPAPIPLYTTTGQNTDQAMTQKAVTDALPTVFPSGRFSVVQGAGQTAAGVRGTYTKPFINLQAAHDASLDGDTILVYPGGTETDAFGRAFYATDFYQSKAVNVVFLPGSLIGGIYWVGVNYSAGGLNVRIYGGEFLNRIILTGGTISSTLLIENTRFTGSLGGVQHVPNFMPNGLLDTMILRNCTVTNTARVNSGSGFGYEQQGPIRLNAVTGTGLCDLTLDNTLVITTNTACLTFSAALGSRMILKGTTELRPGGGNPNTNTFLIGAGASQESQWLVDSRVFLIDNFSVLPYAASIAVDFNTATVLTIAATGNVAYGPSLNVALLRTKEHYLSNTTGAAITLSFPTGWTFFPGPAPTTLAANKQAILTVRSLGTSDSSVKAAWVAQT